MFHVNALFEAWLRESTEKPLSAWKRAALLWRLQEDAELRCYAAELAEFSHESEASDGFSPDAQAWMRQRLQARLKDAGRATLSDGVGAWAGPLAGLAMGALLLLLVVGVPDQSGPTAQRAAVSTGDTALLLPSATPSSTPTPSPTPTPVL